ncbi:MAG: DUF5615 family PIN-like protein [candidate division KSB1 bacterium]|nr:DUF5615 family PIN-like protein [candidate division KSB1 bacterium]
MADENISPKIVQYFRENELDVIDVKEKGWHGKTDKELLNIAYREKCFSLTHDSDCGTLVVHKQINFYGLIYISVKDLNPEHVKSICDKLFRLKIDIEPGSIIVVEESKLRIRQINKN